VLACVLHFVDAGTARGIASTFARMLAPGSYLVISVGFGRGREGTNFASTYNAQNGPPIYSHSWEEITGFFDGLELMPPGIVETSQWSPGQPAGAVGDRESMIVAGVARRPLTRRPAVKAAWAARRRRYLRFSAQHQPQLPHPYHRPHPLLYLVPGAARTTTSMPL